MTKKLCPLRGLDCAENDCAFWIYSGESCALKFLALYVRDIFENLCGGEP